MNPTTCGAVCVIPAAGAFVSRRGKKDGDEVDICLLERLN